MLCGVLDIIYNPARTKLLLDAEDRGLVTENGLWMLVAQAKESAEWFTGEPFDDTCIEAIHTALRSQMENLVLIGMPGCGKSTAASLLAQATGRKAVDADAEIVKEAGCSIAEIFASSGEDAFRALETKVLARLGMESGLIIATGGGCVTRQENYPLLHQNGRIFWLQRDTSLLPTDGRPLSQATKLADMYRIRKPMYGQFADMTVGNDGEMDDTVKAILASLK
jgi:shikimate dehydrogenase